MTISAGIFLKSTVLQNGTIFEAVTIFIVEYNSTGAIGFVINRPYGRSLNELEEFRNSSSFQLYDGGPVDKEHLFLLHRRPDLINGSSKITDDVSWGGNMSDAIVAINGQILTSDDLKIFVGYCGWDAGDLEMEIDEGSWQIVSGIENEIFE